MNEVKEFSAEIAGKKMTAKIGFLAEQAGGSVTLQYGDTVVLATATMSKERREGQDWFPLFVDYEERFYAGGKIKGSRFIKREGRPSDRAVLAGRVVDRTIRPLFDERMRNEVQVITTILSIDGEVNPAVLAVSAASIALGISNIPWNGPVSAIQVGKFGENFKINPTMDELEETELDLIVAGTSAKVNMIEAGAKEISNEKMAEAIGIGFEVVKEINQFQDKIIVAVGKEKTEVELTTPTEEFKQEINAFLDEKGLADAFYTKNKKEQDEKMGEIKQALNEKLEEEFSDESELRARKAEAALIFENYLNKVLHDRILESEERPDGRKPREIREISSQAGVLPRTHGSGLFQRGQTQVLTTATLGAPGDEQIIDTMEVDEKKRYIHHYNFPPYSVGEVRMMRGPGRREIGHGALAEKALEPVLPSKENFPYTMLLVSEVMSSNGSSSMASTCGSTLALMDAGVPITAPVSGIAMGIVTGTDSAYKILSDIQGPEDHWGDMDFKVAGTEKGITAMQLDVKIDGIDPELSLEVLEQAYEARMQIMEVMLQAIPEPRKELSPYAPRIITVKIDPEKIGAVIGTGGKIINEIIDETGCNIDIEDDGSIFITAESAEGGQRAQKWIEDLTKDIEVGEEYIGKVVKVMDFGAFVELAPGKDGLIHISNLSKERVGKVEDVVKEGETVKVKVMEVQDSGKIGLRLIEVVK
jgi:polyribonucleotide nucleotidyltransferase